MNDSRIQTNRPFRSSLHFMIRWLLYIIKSSQMTCQNVLGYLSLTGAGVPSRDLCGNVQMIWFRPVLLPSLPSPSPTGVDLGKASVRSLIALIAQTSFPAHPLHLYRLQSSISTLRYKGSGMASPISLILVLNRVHNTSNRSTHIYRFYWSSSC